MNVKKNKNKVNPLGLVNRTPCATTLDLKLFGKLDNLAKETRIPRSKLLDEAVELLLEKHDPS